jgi:hypothetical protein
MSTICFQLVDEAGQQYRNTSVDTVDVAADTTLSKFRKLVKEENPNTLASLDASQLKVYLNIPDMHDKKLLSSTKKVQGLGDKEENPLIVVVPAQQHGITDDSPTESEIKRRSNRDELLMKIAFDAMMHAIHDFKTDIDLKLYI